METHISIWTIGWLITVGIILEEVRHSKLLCRWWLKLIVVAIYTVGTTVVWPIYLGMTIAESIRKS